MHILAVPQHRRLAPGVVALAAVAALTLSSCSAASSDADETPTPTPEVAAASVDIVDEPYTVAAVNAPSGATLEEGLDLAESITAEAAAGGASLVAFGELWLPGYPKGLNFDENWAEESFPAYVDTAITIGDANWARLLEIADTNDVYVSMGFAERDGDYLYMGQALIDPNGEAIETRRKVRPSGAERAYFSDDDMEGNLEVTETSLGRIGQLECWEHLHPQMTYPMLAQQENLHIAAWPYNPDDSTEPQWWENDDVAQSAARMYAISGWTWVMSPAVGGAFIMTPTGEIVAQASDTSAGNFVTAEIDPTDFDEKPAYDSNGEFSWGVLEMISEQYSGPQEPDEEHGTLNLVKVDSVG